ncbi:xylulokinase [Enterococcus alishanensis]|uniref:Xylulose kinase n=1 Tax=Enterococcus alishanensis TaxID=1303817 RepID=A0ABS6THH4_9ENTE|nr:xylulokinase [Enterococcus alishanensis]MBV7392348.1 xylulokinase [Enterococcus alishanensis]
MTYVLGLDLGTSSLKGLLVNQQGEMIVSASADYPLSNPHAGYSEQNPLGWVAAAKTVIQKLISEKPQAMDKISAISFSGQMHSLVLLDKKQNILRPAILWNDVRTTKECQYIMEHAGELVLEQTKNRPLEGFTLPKMLWVKEHEPDIWEQVATFLLPKDYLGYWMTGNIQTDFSDAAGTLLLDVIHQTWDWKIADIFELPKNIFPKLVDATEIIGTIRQDLAKELGLSPKIKIVAGGADNACAALGAGIDSEDKGLVSVGTSGVFLTFEGENIRDYQGKLHFFNHVIPNAYYSMGVTLAAGQSLNWFKQNFAKKEIFTDFLAEIENVPAGSEGLLFAPYIMGERTPYVDSQIRGSFIGLDNRHHQEHFVRAVIEGITFSLKDSQMIMESIQQKRLKKIVSIGGGAKNKVWLQIQADIFETEIITLQTEQGPGLGAAMLAALGCGWFNSVNEMIQTFVQYGPSYFPTETANVYKKYYVLYKKIYHATKELSHELQNLNT